MIHHRTTIDGARTNFMSQFAAPWLKSGDALRRLIQSVDSTLVNSTLRLDSCIIRGRTSRSYQILMISPPRHLSIISLIARRSRNAACCAICCNSAGLLAVPSRVGFASPRHSESENHQLAHERMCDLRQRLGGSLGECTVEELLEFFGWHCLPAPKNSNGRPIRGARCNSVAVPPMCYLRHR